jgi:phage-related protein
LRPHIQTDIITVKSLLFLGDSVERIREFPDAACSETGYQLYNVQRGLQPDNFKPMPSIGKGVEEIRIRDEAGAFRIIYTARFATAVYVLHAFQKKSMATSKQDIELAKTRFKQLLQGAPNE